MRYLGRTRRDEHNPLTRSNSNSNNHFSSSSSSSSSSRGTKCGVKSMWENDSEAYGQRTSR